MIGGLGTNFHPSGTTGTILGTSNYIAHSNRDLEPATIIVMKWEIVSGIRKKTTISHNRPHQFSVQAYCTMQQQPYLTGASVLEDDDTVG
jgi:hypothetical protein